MEKNSAKNAKRLKPPVNFLKKNSIQIYILLIIIIAFYLRTFNINWDNGYYFHPDERAIVMFTIPLNLPSSVHEFFTPASPLNPHFFAYGSFPLYLLKLSSTLASFINQSFSQYSQMYVVGRLISASFDTLTVFLVFIIASTLFSKRTGIFASLLYALFVFPIQSSHFYAVDPMLTFFMTGALFAFIQILRNMNYSSFIFLGIFLGLALATKISALSIVPIIISVILLKTFSATRKKTASYHLILLKPLIFVLITCLIFAITQPYAIIDFHEFTKQTLSQSQMSRNPFIFPYTLQYVGKVPYIYELTNIFLWGIGPTAAIICFAGSVKLLLSVFQKKFASFELLAVLFYSAFYFFLFGGFAVGWMRYMLPIYPVLAVYGGFLISEVVIRNIKIKDIVVKKSLLFIFLLVLMVYPLSFITIYTKPNTRVQASDWINKNIPYGSTIAVEHWDDSLPIYGQENYTHLTLPLYDPDTKEKWQSIDSVLGMSDYVIIASNRLYVPLQKLTDCNKLPVGRCYPLTAKYYKDLFSGKLGFKKAASFSMYPTVPFLGYELHDDTADESFTVNDHPKIFIFKKIK